MIKIKQSLKKCHIPHYILTYNYMIGDADGNAKEEVKISLDNPYVERYCKLLNSLKPSKCRIGVFLDSDSLTSYYQEGQITHDDYEFLDALMFEEGFEDDEYSFEFFEGVRSECEYFFLVFEGCDLIYVDEYGVKHETYFE